MLRSGARRRSEGRRDYAVLITLLRLGLRAGEVAQLTLDDIDWRAAEIVHGKGRRDDGLPLPVDVGEAVAGYLRRGRPATTRREVFLRALAPVAPLGRGGVSSIVRRACVRTGMSPIGAHRLRHTPACDMVSVGVPLSEIGQVLRHRSVSSTAIYACVDLEALRGGTRPCRTAVTKPPPTGSARPYDSAMTAASWIRTCQPRRISQPGASSPSPPFQSEVNRSMAGIVRARAISRPSASCSKASSLPGIDSSPTATSIDAASLAES